MPRKLAPNTASASLATGNLSYAIAKQILSSDDIARLACAFLNSGSLNSFDADAAAAQFGSGCKPASFKRQIGVIARKIREAQDADLGDPSVDLPAVAVNVKGAAGRKRKAEGEEEIVGKRGKGNDNGKGKGRKTAIKAEVECDEGEDEDVEVKVEKSERGGLEDELDDSV